MTGTGMTKMRYIGARPELHEKTALVRRNGMRGVVEAQFDDLTLGVWAHGWHFFPARMFASVEAVTA